MKANRIFNGKQFHLFDEYGTMIDVRNKVAELKNGKIKFSIRVVSRGKWLTGAAIYVKEKK
jgi:hypothetical protein